MLNFCVWRSMSSVSYVLMKTRICYLSCRDVKQDFTKKKKKCQARYDERKKVNGKYNKEINKMRRT